MAMTVTTTFVFNASTTAEYAELLARANAWRVADPAVVASVTGAPAQRRVTIVTTAQPHLFAAPTWVPLPVVV